MSLKHDLESALGRLYYFIDMAEKGENFTNTEGKKVVANAKAAFAFVESNLLELVKKELKKSQE